MPQKDIGQIVRTALAEALGISIERVTDGKIISSRHFGHICVAIKEDTGRQIEITGCHGTTVGRLIKRCQ